jgi:hypothetical protein
LDPFDQRNNRKKSTSEWSPSNSQFLESQTLTHRMVDTLNFGPYHNLTYTSQFDFETRLSFALGFGQSILKTDCFGRYVFYIDSFSFKWYELLELKHQTKLFVQVFVDFLRRFQNCFNF